LLLDDNEQTDEALKHIQTVLNINEQIEISIDCVTVEAKEADDVADAEEIGESNSSSKPPGAPTIVSIVPLEHQQAY
tara:strand:+ start:238 stop:468 length:231 start_codon:yes stop_codon:yes gene_type:complete